MRYAKSTGCFYPEDMQYQNLPSDIVTVPDEDFVLANSRAPTEDIDLVEGRIVVVAKPAPLLADLKHTAQGRIDAYYQVLFDMAVPNNAMKAEYDAAYMVAKRWLENPVEPIPERIKALAESYGVTNLEAAQVVVQKWTEAQAVAFDLRGAARLRAKLAIRQAVDAEGVAAAEMAGRNAMAAITYTI